MSIIATKTEIAEVAALLQLGADSPEDLARAVIRRLSEMREERKQYDVVFELTPGAYVSFGPYATDAAARKAIPKIPMAQVAKRCAVVVRYGQTSIDAGIAKADAPRESRFDIEIQRDQQAFKRGWRGNIRDRDQYIGGVA